MIVTGAGMVGLLSPGPVDADQHSATRSFSGTTVSGTTVVAGGELVVTIEVADYGPVGQLVETLPAGFSYVSTTSSYEPNVEGQEVKFRLVGQTSFAYTVTASDTAGSYTFSGVVKNEDRDERDVGGESDLTVEAAAATPIPSPTPTETPTPQGLRATRSLPDAAVDVRSEFDVTIEVADYGAVGQLVETLPAGFSYVSTTSSFEPNVEGQEVKFRLVGQTSFAYTVTASDTAGSYTFSGVVKNEDREEATVGGDSGVTVQTHNATRSLPDEPVEPGTQFDVMIEVAGYGVVGQLVETLPAGFSYVSTTSSFEPNVEGQEVTFRLLGESSFTYTVTASGTEGDYTFSGVVWNDDREEAPVGGDSTVTVMVAVTPTPTPTPTPDTPTPTPTPEPPPTPTASPSPPTTGVSGPTGRLSTLTVGGSSSRVNLPSVFTDMETDGLTYTAVSSRSSVVRARVSGIILRLTPVGAGTSRITVTATDADGKETLRTLTVRVRAAEMPPVGDLTAPDWLLALLALAGAALLPAGVLMLRSRRRRSNA